MEEKRQIPHAEEYYVLINPQHLNYGLYIRTFFHKVQDGKGRKE